MIWGLANPKIGEREALATMLDASSDLVADGQVILADKGFRQTVRSVYQRGPQSAFAAP